MRLRIEKVREAIIDVVDGEDADGYLVAQELLDSGMVEFGKEEWNYEIVEDDDILDGCVSLRVDSQCNKIERVRSIRAEHDALKLEGKVIFKGECGEESVLPSDFFEDFHSFADGIECKHELSGKWEYALLFDGENAREATFGAYEKAKKFFGHFKDGVHYKYWNCVLDKE